MLKDRMGAMEVELKKVLELVEQGAKKGEIILRVE
jgi:hypothetical protein